MIKLRLFNKLIALFKNLTFIKENLNIQIGSIWTSFMTKGMLLEQQESVEKKQSWLPKGNVVDKLKLNVLNLIFKFENQVVDWLLQIWNKLILYTKETILKWLLTKMIKLKAIWWKLKRKLKKNKLIFKNLPGACKTHKMFGIPTLTTLTSFFWKKPKNGELTNQNYKGNLKNSKYVIWLKTWVIARIAKREISAKSTNSKNAERS